MKLSDLLGCLGGAALLISAFMIVPVLGPLFGLLTPLPFLYFSTKLGFAQGLKASALVLLLIGLTAHLADQTHLALFSVEFAVLGMVLSELYRRNLSYGQTLLWGTIAMLGVGFGFLYAAGLSQGLGPFDVIQGYLKEQLNAVMALYGSAADDPEKAAELQSYGRSILEVLLEDLPLFDDHRDGVCGLDECYGEQASFPFWQAQIPGLCAPASLAGAGIPGLGGHRFGIRFIFGVGGCKIHCMERVDRSDGGLPAPGRVYPFVFL